MGISNNPSSSNSSNQYLIPDRNDPTTLGQNSNASKVPGTVKIGVNIASQISDLASTSTKNIVNTKSIEKIDPTTIPQSDEELESMLAFIEEDLRMAQESLKIYQIRLEKVNNVFSSLNLGMKEGNEVSFFDNIQLGNAIGHEEFKEKLLRGEIVVHNFSKKEIQIAGPFEEGYEMVENPDTGIKEKLKRVKMDEKTINTILEAIDSHKDITLKIAHIQTQIVNLRSQLQQLRDSKNKDTENKSEIHQSSTFSEFNYRILMRGTYVPKKEKKRTSEKKYDQSIEYNLAFVRSQKVGKNKAKIRAEKKELSEEMGERFTQILSESIKHQQKTESMLKTERKSIEHKFIDVRHKIVSTVRIIYTPIEIEVGKKNGQSLKKTVGKIHKQKEFTTVKAVPIL